MFSFLQCFMFSTVSAQPVSVWGVAEGNTKSYIYYKIYTGSISEMDTRPVRTYRIANLYDNDGNNYYELLLEIRTTSTEGLPQTSTNLLNDANSSWTDSGLRPTNTTYSMFNPLYPTQFNGTDSVGFNWSKSLENYNTGSGIPDWNMTIIGNIATINRSYSGTEDGADFDVTIEIKWDVSTGWLTSYDEIKAYNQTLGYTVHYQTTVYTSSGEAALDLGFLFAIIALILGAASIGIILIVWKKKS